MKPSPFQARIYLRITQKLMVLGHYAVFLIIMHIQPLDDALVGRILKSFKDGTLHSERTLKETSPLENKGSTPYRDTEGFKKN